MYKKVYVISWNKGSGPIHQTIFATQAEADEFADKLMDREENDGIPRNWMISTFYSKRHD